MIMLSQDDSNEVKKILHLFKQYLTENTNKEQYVIKNVKKCDIPSTLAEEFAKGSKYINHFKTDGKIQYSSFGFEREETYCIIFERNKADN